MQAVLVVSEQSDCLITAVFSNLDSVILLPSSAA